MAYTLLALAGTHARRSGGDRNDISPERHYGGRVSAPKRKPQTLASVPASEPLLHEPAASWTAGDRLGSFFAQNKILAGAAEVFRKKGVEAATIEDILVASGVSRRTFYKAFSNKEDVLVALHRELSSLFLSAMRAALEDARSPEERVARCVDVYLLAAQRSGGLMLALQAEALRGGQLAVRRKEALAAVAALIEEGARWLGREPPDPLLLFGLLNGLEAVVRSLMEESRMSDADFARARRVMMRLAIATLAETGDTVPPLPRASAPSAGR